VKRQEISQEEAIRRLDSVLENVKSEVLRAINRHGGFASAHEGHSVIREELEELWDEVKANCGYDPNAMNEALQVAAMGVKYIIFLAPPAD
jgi:hypothetical protein